MKCKRLRYHREVLTLTDIPKSHPRYASLLARERVAEGVKKGITSNQGLIAQGRGECFDYLLGEKTTPSAEAATHAAAALLLLANRPALSINGNVAALVPEEMVELASVLKIPLEVNLFHRSEETGKKNCRYSCAIGAQSRFWEKSQMRRYLAWIMPVLWPPEAESMTLMWSSFPWKMETAARLWLQWVKKVIAIDLNPLSRTARKATVSIVDNIMRAVPNLTEQVKRLRAASWRDLEEIVQGYDNNQNSTPGRGGDARSPGPAVSK